MVNRRSLKASEEGIKKARTALIGKGWKQKDLYENENVQLGISTVKNFFRGIAIDYQNFVNICQALELEWQEVADCDIDRLVQQVRGSRYEKIQYQCGSLRMLDVARPIALTDIFTEVNVLEQITSQQWRDIGELIKGFNPELNNFDRLGLGRVRQARVSGLDAVSQYQKLKVLGKPGSGKTTFLQHIAIKCNEGEFEPQRVPIFIKLKEFAEDAIDNGELNLLDYIIEEFNSCRIEPEIIKNLLTEGKALILLDGLDEVGEEDSDKVVREIRKLAHNYHKNYFVITCRIATSKYQFQEFTNVEVADFDSKQVKSFAQKWFVTVARNNPSEGKALADRFIYKLLRPENQSIRELAVTPILLNLTCLVFQAKADFPLNRANLYEQGLDILLRRWDEARGICRDEVYHSLTLIRKKQLLCHLAAITFEQGDYFFEQTKIQRLIADYLQTLPDAKTDPEELLLDSEAVLKSIEAQHGLLVERARGIYSFSHLTFQEYFTAKEIVYNSTSQTLEKLVSHLNEKRWREVFLLVAEMLDKTDTLLQLIKQHIDLMVASDEKLQQLLTWINQKSCSVTADCKASAIRVFYFSRVRAHIFNLPHADSFDFARVFDPAFQPSFDILLDRELDRLFGFTFNHTLNIRTALCHIIITVLCYPIDQRPSFDYIFGFTLNLNEERPEIVCKLWYSLQLLSYQLPNSNQDKENFKEWWKINGQTWREQLKKVMIDRRNIGHDWQFKEQSKELLEQYFNANLFLLDCLNHADNVTPAVREEIEATLLLPIAEIEQRVSC